MLEPEEVARLLAIGEEQLEELGVRSAARTAGSDPVNEGSSPSPPATFDADCSGSERAFEAREVGS